MEQGSAIVTETNSLVLFLQNIHKSNFVDSLLLNQLWIPVLNHIHSVLYSYHMQSYTVYESIDKLNV